jgi:hypothetical protein
MSPAGEHLKAAFRVAGLEVEVYKWDATATAEGVVLYATIGASAYPMAGRDPEHRMEYFLGLLPPQDAVASPLAALSLRPGTAHVSCLSTGRNPGWLSGTQSDCQSLLLPDRLADAG